MMSLRNKILLIIIMLVGFLLSSTSRTSADIFDEEHVPAKFDMATLELSQNSTANASVKSQMFNIFQIQPHGYDVGAIRIKKKGQLGFQYRLKAVMANGSALCNALEVEVLNYRTSEYTGLLKNLSIDKTIDDDGQDDWVIFLMLNQSSDSLQNKQCDFQFVFKTWGNGPDDTTGFWDEAVVTNTVTTGIW